MLLMSLDTATASELLKDMNAEVIQDIAMELALLDASGQRDTKEEMKIVQEFYNTLQNNEGYTLSIKAFLDKMLTTAVSKNKAEEIQSQIREATKTEDPFVPIRSVRTDELVLALSGEHPQTIAVVLSELSVQKSQEVISYLNEEDCLKAIPKMTNPAPLGTVVKQRIASTVSEKLKSFKGETLAARPEQNLRKLAIMLSGLEKNLRYRLLDEIGKHDEKTRTQVRDLMVTWEDIQRIADRSLQEALREANTQVLAVALYEADEDIAQKIRSNISERATAAVDEETSLMQEPLQKEVLDARETVVQPLRAANKEDKLRFTRK